MKNLFLYLYWSFSDWRLFNHRKLSNFGIWNFWRIFRICLLVFVLIWVYRLRDYDLIKLRCVKSARSQVYLSPRFAQPFKQTTILQTEKQKLKSRQIVAGILSNQNMSSQSQNVNEFVGYLPLLFSQGCILFDILDYFLTSYGNTGCGVLKGGIHD